MKHFLIVAAMLLVLAGCTSKPISNVNGAAVFTGTGSQLTLDKVRWAIVSAATRKGWVVKDTGPGEMLATLHTRKHMAEVKIVYSTRTYSITYNDSHTLDYDGTAIHRNYNRWVQNLQKQINLQLGQI